MSQNENVETIDLKSFIKGQASLKATNLTKIAEKLGKKQSSLSGRMNETQNEGESLLCGRAPLSTRTAILADQFAPSCCSS